MAYLMNSLLEPMYEDADVYDRYSLLSPYTQPYADAGMKVPQVQTAPQLQTAPPQPQAQSLDYYGTALASGVSGGYEGPFNTGYINWTALPGYEAFWRDATGNGDNYQEAGLRLPELYQYLDQNGIRVQEDPLPNNGFTRYAVDASGKPIEATRITGRADTFSDILGDAVKLAAVMGTAYLGGTALAGAGGGTAAAALPGISAADAAYALGMGETAVGGALAPTAAGGSALANLGSVTQVGTPLTELGAVGLPTAEVGLPGLLAPEAAQVITITAPKAVDAATPSLLAPAAATVAAAPVINSLTSDAPYSNEGRTPSEPRGNMGGEGTPEVPTVNVEPTPWDQFKAWATANPEMARMAFSAAGGLLSASGGSSGGSGGYRDSGYRPTVARGGWQPSVTQRTMPTTPLSLNLPRTGQPNSGLWRYGLLGG